uniref:hypothetical protein n=1 Tax=Nocardia brevicatena TaxID=37327 RepID=UPI000594BA75
IADRRAPARRLEAEHRRVRRQASRALDRLLAPESCTPEGARVRRELAAAERDQEFYRRADLWLADIGRALAYADPDETLARLATATRALGAEQTRKIA